MSIPLTDVQLEILDLIWSHEECTISFLWEELKKRRPLARNTVLTHVHRLEERGVLERRPRGRSHGFRSRIERQNVEKQKLQGTIDSLFQGSAENLVRALIGNELVSSEEMSRLKHLLDEAEAKANRRNPRWKS